MARTYLPYSGEIFNYGYGPEHNFFGQGQTPPPGAPGGAPSLAVPGNSVLSQPGIQDQGPGGNAQTGGSFEQNLGTPENPATTQTTGQMARDTAGAVGSLFGGGIGWGQVAGMVAGALTGAPLGTLAGWGERAMGISSDARAQTNTHGYFGSGIPSQMSGGAAAQLAAEKAGIDSSGGMSWGGDGGMTASGGDYSGDKGPSSGEGSAKGDGGGGWSDSGLYAEGGPIPREGGQITGPGDGLSDSVPAMIDGQAPAALSTDEHVIPADVVSMIGNGSSQAGHAKLQEMIANVRKMKTGDTKQAAPLPQDTLGQTFEEGGPRAGDLP